MRIRVNGKEETLSEGMTVLDYLDGRKLESHRVVVELNKNIVMNEDYIRTILKDGDRLEVLGFVGGG